MASGTWRGIVCVISPLMVQDHWWSLSGFFRKALAASRCTPISRNIRNRLSGAMETYHVKMAELAEIGVDLMHPEGCPPFMVRGHKVEQESLARGGAI